MAPGVPRHPFQFLLGVVTSLVIFITLHNFGTLKDLRSSWRPSWTKNAAKYGEPAQAVGATGTSLHGTIKSNTVPSPLLTFNITAPRIPRLVHQLLGFFDTTWHRLEGPIDPEQLDFSGISMEIKLAMKSWITQNPDYEYRLWDYHAVTALIEEAYPQYRDLWHKGIVKPVEKSDFARYLLVYHFGGVYSDIDTTCVEPMNRVIRSSEQMVVGWEHFRTLQKSQSWGLRQAQLNQWWFAGMPGHPALLLLLETIKSERATVFYSNFRDALERTGPGLFTRTLLRYEAERPRGDPSVTILPQTVSGNYLNDGRGTRDLLFRGVEHMFANSWHGQYQEKDKDSEKERKSSQKTVYKDDEIPVSPVELFPTTLLEEPRFVMAHYLPDTGKLLAERVDVSRAIVLLGTPGLNGDFTGPSRSLGSFFESVERFAFGKKGLANRRQGVILDVGAGYGLVSLSAAIRGFRAVAYEEAAPHLRALETSVHYNGFEDAVVVVPGIWTPSSKNSELKQVEPCPTDVSEAAAHGYDRRFICGHRLPALKALQNVSASSIVGMHLNTYALTDALLGSISSALLAMGNPPLLIELGPQPEPVPVSGVSAKYRWIHKLWEQGYRALWHYGPACANRWNLGVMIAQNQLVGQGVAVSVPTEGCRMPLSNVDAVMRIIFADNLPETLILTSR